MIIGICGTNGAGKGSVVLFLIKSGFKHYSVRGFLLEELARQGLKPTRDNMIWIANNIRKTEGSDFIIKSLIEKSKGKVVVESIRCLSEAKYLKEQGAFLLGVDADIALRYDRAVKRASTTDSVSFSEFVALEKKELDNKDEYKQNIRACLDLCDYIVENNSDFKELERQVDEFLKFLELK